MAIFPEKLEKSSSGWGLYKQRYGPATLSSAVNSESAISIPFQ